MENKPVRNNASCSSCTCVPRASWDRASDMLTGDMMIFGCSSVVCKFCSSCMPSFWMAAAMTFIGRRLGPAVRQASSCSSSDEPPLSRPTMAVVSGISVSGCAVTSLSTFYRQKRGKTLSGYIFGNTDSDEQNSAATRQARSQNKILSNFSNLPRTSMGRLGNKGIGGTVGIDSSSATSAFCRAERCN